MSNDEIKRYSCLVRQFVHHIFFRLNDWQYFNLYMKKYVFYNFRYSLNGTVKPMPVPYLPADTKIGSISNPNSDDYINSRPDSRYSHQSRPVSGPSRTRSRSRNRSRSKHRQVQSSSSGQSGSTQYSRAESTGRLVANGSRI